MNISFFLGDGLNEQEEQFICNVRDNNRITVNEFLNLFSLPFADYVCSLGISVNDKRFWKIIDGDYVLDGHEVLLRFSPIILTNKTPSGNSFKINDELFRSYNQTNRKAECSAKFSLDDLM